MRRTVEKAGAIYIINTRLLKNLLHRGVVQRLHQSEGYTHNGVQGTPAMWCREYQPCGAEVQPLGEPSLAANPESELEIGKGNLNRRH